MKLEIGLSKFALRKLTIRFALLIAYLKSKPAAVPVGRQRAPSAWHCGPRRVFAAQGLLDFESNAELLVSVTQDQELYLELKRIQFELSFEVPS